MSEPLSTADLENAIIKTFAAICNYYGRFYMKRDIESIEGLAALVDKLHHTAATLKQRIDKEAETSENDGHATII
jgi:hypothetical protein